MRNRKVPALLLAAFTALLVGPDVYFTVPGLVGLLPLAAAVLAAVLCAERPAVRPLPGRVAGVVYLLAGLAHSSFTPALFWAGAVTTAIPGIILHIILIPVLVMAMEKARLILD